MHRRKLISSTAHFLKVARHCEWEDPRARAMMNGELALDAIVASAEAKELSVMPRLVRHERLGNLINRYF
jgi:xylose isomerase